MNRDIIKMKQGSLFVTKSISRWRGIPLVVWIGVSSLSAAEETGIKGPAVILNGEEVSSGISMTALPAPIEDENESLSASSCSISDDSSSGGGCSLKDFYSGVSSEVPAMPT